MVRALGINEWNELEIPIMDVRSQKEFIHGHIPNAHSIPLFSDDERAIVGTLYKHEGREIALDKALELVGPNISVLVKQTKSISEGKKIKIHCWRGGLRSGSVAWLLDTMGFNEVYTLQGGYKNYRRWILSLFEVNYPLVILGGRTGSGKTEILKALSQQNEAVIDLEGLAHHKGSAFGGIGEKDQPTNEQFENLLGEELHQLKENRNIWLEDESENIGKIKIPHVFFEKMRSSVVYFLDISASVRVPHLVNTYAHYGDEKLQQSILKIQKRLGGSKATQALKALDNKDYEQVATIALYYYDKSYEAGLNKRPGSQIVRIKSDTIDPMINAEIILKAKQNNINAVSQTYSI